MVLMHHLEKVEVGRIKNIERRLPESLLVKGVNE